MRGVLDTTLCDKVWQWLATGLWFSPGSPVSTTNKSDRHDIPDILLKVLLNIINQIKPIYVDAFSSDRFWILCFFLCHKEWSDSCSVSVDSLVHVLQYSETCVKWTSLVPTFVFCLYRILFYSGFRLDRFHNNNCISVNFNFVGIWCVRHVEFLVVFHRNIVNLLDW